MPFSAGKIGIGKEFRILGIGVDKSPLSVVNGLKEDKNCIPTDYRKTAVTTECLTTKNLL